MREIIVDNFAGGGGASTGIEMATGRSVDIAINHDPAAIAMHRVNHPDTEHYLESVWDVDPYEATQGRPVALCWLSPDCKHFSKAKGGKPVEKSIRGLAWVALRWALVSPRVMMLENVEEFKTWGPIDEEGQPIKERVGETFQAFVAALSTGLDPKHPAMEEIQEVLGPDFPIEKVVQGFGYQVEWNELVACDYGAPTRRKRLFMVMRRDGKPIVWPEPTHGDPNSLEVKSGRLKPYRTAAEIIDWSLPCKSIFVEVAEFNDITEDELKAQLDDWEVDYSRIKVTTEKKLKKALYKLYLKTANKLGYRTKPLAENTMRRIARGLKKFVIDNPNPFIIKVNHGGDMFRGQELDEPMQTITAKNGWGVVMPYIARIGQTGFGGDKLAYGMEQPLTTITSKAEHLLVVPHVTKFRGGSTGHAIDEPLHTITSGAGSKRPAGAAHAMGMVAAFLTKYHGETTGTEALGQTMDSPVATLDTSNRFGFATVSFLAKNYGGKYTGACIGTDEPISTVTTKDHHALVTSHMIKMRGTNIGHRTDEPLHTVTSGGLHLGQVQAFLIKYFGTGDGQDIEEPLHTITTKDRFGLVTIHGQEYQIVNIRMRMLEPHELFKAQGFPPYYKIDVDADGKKYPKDQKVARCGNAVPPPFAEHLVRANLPEHCTVPGGYTSVADLRVEQMGLAI